MNQLVRDVADFHKRLGFPIAQGPTPRILARRLALLDEEASEVIGAMLEAQQAVETGAGTTEALRLAVQELIDLTYVIAGTFVELGIDPQPAWEAVHAANLQKARPADGGKAVKPDGWQAPVVPVLPLAFEATAAHAT